MNSVETILESFGITPTPIRKLIYKCFLDHTNPLSLSDLELILDSVDKSTISRTLSKFMECHLLHSFNDGSGSVKYELCKSPDHSIKDDHHVHFRCEKCGQTLCLTHLHIPLVELPKGYLIKDVNYIITGICAECS